MADYQLPLPGDEQRIAETGAAGDPTALDLMYRAYARALRAFCQVRLGDRAAAEDAAHETILKAHAAMGRFRPEARLWPWLATIAARVCADMRRAHRRQAGFDPERSELHPAADLEADQQADQRIRVELVEDAMRELPPRYRAHLYRRDYQGLTYEEIAELEGTSVASVRSVLLRARRALRHKITDLAQSRGQWPLPAFLPLGLARLRASWDGARSSIDDKLAQLWWRAAPLEAAGASLASAVVITLALGASVAAVPAAQPPIPAGPAGSADAGGALPSPVAAAAASVAGAGASEVVTTPVPAGSTASPLAGRAGTAGTPGSAVALPAVPDSARLLGSVPGPPAPAARVTLPAVPTPSSPPVGRPSADVAPPDVAPPRVGPPEVSGPPAGDVSPPAAAPPPLGPPEVSGPPTGDVSAPALPARDGSGDPAVTPAGRPHLPSLDVPAEPAR